MEKKKNIYSLLIKLQITKELLGSGLKKKGDKARSMAGTIALYIALGILLAGSFGAMFLGLAEIMGDYGFGWIYMGAMGFMIIFMSFLMSVFLVHSQLFESKDNDLLLSMPIKPRAILVSRVVGLLVMSYGTAALIALPALFIYVRANGLSPIGFLAFAVEFLVLPMLGVTLAITIGWAVGTIVSKSRHKKIVQTVLTLVGVALYLLFYMNFSAGFGKIIEVAIQNSDGIKNSVPVFYHMGNAIAGGDIVSMLITAAICLIPFIIACYLVSLNFNKILTGNKGVKKIEYKAGRMAASGKMSSMIKLEFSRFFSSPTYMMNGAIGLVMMVIMPIIVIFQINGSEDIDELGMDVGSFLGKQEITPAILMVIMLFMLSFVITAAATVSLDAKTLWILKSGPVKGDSILLAKAAPQIILGIPFIIAATIVSSVFLKLGILKTLLIMLALLLANLFNSLLDLIIGVKYPKLDWLTEMEAVKQSKAGIISMMVNVAIPALIIIAFVLLRKVKFYKTIPFMIGIVVVYILLSALLYRHIKKNGQAMLDGIKA